MNKGKELKLQGNEQFRRGAFRPALALYAQAFSYLNALYVPTTTSSTPSSLSSEHKRVDYSPDLQEEILKVRVDTELNAARCFIRLGEAAKALPFCQRAVDMDTKSSKAKLCRAIASIAVNDIDQAQSDLAAVASVLDRDPSYRQAQADLTRLQRQHRKKEQAS